MSDEQTTDEKKAPAAAPAPGTEEYDQLCNWYLARLRTFSDPAFTPAALVNADKAKLEELVLAQIPADETKTSGVEVATVKAPVGWWKRFKEGLTSLFK